MSDQRGGIRGRGLQVMNPDIVALSSALIWTGHHCRTLFLLHSNKILLVTVVKYVNHLTFDCSVKCEFKK